MYGEAEASLGGALEGRRDGTTVATKIWTPSVEDGRAQYDAQRRHFGRVEIEQVHNLVAWEEHLPWLENLRASGRRLLPLAEELGIAVIVLSPFGGTGAPLLRRSPTDAELAPLRPFGIETWAQTLLKWVLSDSRVDLVIPATSRPARAAENAAAASPPWLGTDERAYVERLSRA